MVCCQIGHLALRDLEVSQRFAKLHALLGVLHELTDHIARRQRASGGEAQPTRVQRVHCDGEALTHFTEHVVDRHFQVVESQLGLRRALDAKFAEGALDVKARHIGPDDERRRAHHDLAISFHRRLRERGQYAGAMTVANPVLAAAHQPVRPRFVQSR